MDFKTVIQEQVKKLQELQNEIISSANSRNEPNLSADAACIVARTIVDLCEKASQYEG